jgi:hypothetical protein
MMYDALHFTTFLFFCFNPTSHIMLAMHVPSPSPVDMILVFGTICRFHSALSALKASGVILKSTPSKIRSRRRAPLTNLYINSAQLKFSPDDFLINYWVTRDSDGAIDTFEASGGIWRIVGEEIVCGSRSSRKVVLGREQRNIAGLKATQREYGALRATIGRYFKQTSQRPFRDVLIKFSDIPTSHPDLFAAIRKWAAASN